MTDSTKACSRCGELKPYSDFSKRAAMRDGHRSQCKACDAADRKASRDSIEQTRRAWRAANREKERASERRRYANNAERERRRKAAWERANPEKLREIKRRTRDKYPEKSAERTRRWRLANPDMDRLWREANRETCRAGLLRYRARKRRLTIVQFTPQQLAARLSMFSGCWMCGGEWTEVDHVKPLNKGGPHVLANLRPACRSDNARKNDRWPFPTTRAALLASGWLAA